MEDENQFGQWLKRRRRQLDLTQQQLADCAACSAVTIRKFETGERRPSRELAELLADCLALRPDERDLFVAQARGVTAINVVAQEPAKVGSGPFPPLPQPATPFIGRAEELAQIAAALADPSCRLLTLVGAGGMGKTRLAQAAAQAQTGNFAHGVVFVPLMAVTEPAHLPHTIAHQLRITLAGGDDPATQLGRFLQNKELLLVLDNFEQLLEGVESVAGWLSAAPQTKWLITSRERLNLVEEWLLAVRGFAQADPGVALFAQTARRVQPEFSLAGQEMAVAQICQLVGGMPLAIELAAGWTALLSCEQIVGQMQQVFDFLSTGLRNVPQRHRSLRYLFDQSWQLLSPPEQDVLMKLSVFQGGFRLEEGQAIAGASLPLLLALTNKSLVHAGGQGRYDLHELTRQYAGEKLQTSGQEPTVRRQHVQTFTLLAETAEPRLYGPDAVAWFQRLEAEWENLRTALVWAVQVEAVDSLPRLVVSLSWFWFRRGYWREGERWTVEALHQAEPVDSPQRCMCLLSLATLIALQGRYGEALPHLMEATAMAQRLADPVILARTLLILGIATPDAEESLALFDRALASWEAAGHSQNLWLPAHLHNMAGDRLRESGHFAEAAMRYQQSLVLHRQVGYVDNLAYPLGNLGRLALHDGRLVEAQALMSESVELARALGNRQIMGDWLTQLAWATLFLHDSVRAESYIQEALDVAYEIGNRRGQAEASACLALVKLCQKDVPIAKKAIAESLNHFRAVWQQSRKADESLSPFATRVTPDFVDTLFVAGLVAAAQDQHEQAITLLALTRRLQQSIGHSPALPLQQEMDGVVTAVRRTLSTSVYQSAWDAGQDWSLDEIFHFVLA